MPAEQHLPARASVEEDHGRHAAPRRGGPGEERVGRAASAHPRRRRSPAAAPPTASAGKSLGMASVARSRSCAAGSTSAGRAGHRASERSRAMCWPSLRTTGDHSMPCPLVTRVGRVRICRFSPQVPPVSVILIGIENHFAAVGRERHIFDFEILPASSACRRLRERDANRDASSRHPPREKSGGHPPSRTAAGQPPRWRKTLPRPSRAFQTSWPTRCHVGNANRPGRPGALGAKLFRVGDRRQAQIGDLLAVGRPTGSRSRSTLGSR